MRHGPHYAARKPASTRPAPLTVESKFSAVSSIVARHWVSAAGSQTGPAKGAAQADIVGSASVPFRGKLLAAVSRAGVPVRQACHDLAQRPGHSAP